MRSTTKLLSALAVIIGTAGPARAAAPDVDVTVARADAMKQQMNAGKNYADAWGAASGPARESTAQWEQHQRAMNAGKDHSDARAMPPGNPDAVMANAQRHEAAMNRGLDHEDARATSHER